MNLAVRTTPLNQWHKQNNAHMAVFSGYEMPLWYSAGTRSEHLSVITHAGLFDTSHMASILVAGPDALPLLQYTFSKDLQYWNGKEGAAMPYGRCVYGVFLNHDGSVIDDTVVYRFSDDCFMAVVNAGMGEAVTAHLQSCREALDATVMDLTGRVGKMDVQGPLSARILLKVLEAPEAVLEKMVYFSFKGVIEPFRSQGKTVSLTNGIPVILSRTGYTGEFGFELYMDAADLPAAWALIADAGQPFALQACGLAARDSLRTGAVLPLSHQDIGPWPYARHPWLFALPFAPGNDAFTKSFVGERVLQIESTADYTYPFAGSDPRKIDTESAAVVDGDGNRIGRVLSCTTDMAIGRHEGRIFSIASRDKPGDFRPKGLACGFVKVNQPLSPGTVITLKDDRRAIPVRIENDIRPDRTARCAMDKMIADA